MSAPHTHAPARPAPASSCAESPAHEHGAPSPLGATNVRAHSDPAQPAHVSTAHAARGAYAHPTSSDSWPCAATHAPGDRREPCVWCGAPNGFACSPNCAADRLRAATAAPAGIAGIKRGAGATITATATDPAAFDAWCAAAERMARYTATPACERCHVPRAPGGACDCATAPLRGIDEQRCASCGTRHRVGALGHVCVGAEAPAPYEHETRAAHAYAHVVAEPTPLSDVHLAAMSAWAREDGAEPQDALAVDAAPDSPPDALDALSYAAREDIDAITLHGLADAYEHVRVLLARLVTHHEGLVPERAVRGTTREWVTSRAHFAISALVQLRDDARHDAAHATATQEGT